MPGLNKQAQRPKKCWACARNQHKNCDLHMNDGAVDAEEFIDVRCDCPCEGSIGTQYDSLIDMVMAYKTIANDSEQKARTQSMLAARSASTADEALELIRAFLGRGYDDEGNLIQDRKGKIFEEAVGRLTAGLERIAAEQEAVFNQLMHGDKSSNIADVIAQLFGHADADAADGKDRVPWWQSHTWSPHDSDYASMDDDGPGDVPDSELSTPIPTPKPQAAPTPTDEQLMYDRWFKGMRFGRQPVVTGKVEDDWAYESESKWEDEGWPSDA
jgi:hypothetical protein